MFVIGFSAGLLSLILILGITLIGELIDESIFINLKDSVRDKLRTRKERKRTNAINEKYKTGMVVGVFGSNPYDDVPYWLVTSERLNINGDKYVELKPCDECGNYKETAKPLVFSVAELYRKKYVAVQNKK